MRWQSSGPVRSARAGSVDSIEIRIHTGADLVTDLTAEIGSFCRGRGDGLLNVFVPHATAGVGVIETGSGTEEDLAATIERLWPTGVRYAHSHGSRGHGRDHVLPAFVSPSLVVPVLDGRPALGTWQSIVIIDSNVDNPDRRVRLTFLTG
jgi:secondary thiamine-phosphate synthase enzyme